MEENFPKPLWGYSMQEFIAMQKKELEGTIKEMFTLAINELKSDQPPVEDSIGLSDAVKITGLKEKSIYSKISRLEIPVVTRGRPLVFSRAELQLLMKLGRPTVAQLELKKRKGEL